MHATIKVQIFQKSITEKAKNPAITQNYCTSKVSNYSFKFSQSVNPLLTFRDQPSSSLHVSALPSPVHVQTYPTI